MFIKGNSRDESEGQSEGFWKCCNTFVNVGCYTVLIKRNIGIRHMSGVLEDNTRAGTKRVFDLNPM